MLRGRGEPCVISSACVSPQDLDDWTGINSWIAPAASLLVLVLCTYLPLPDKYKYGPFPEGSWFAPKPTAKKPTKLDIGPPATQAESA